MSSAASKAILTARALTPSVDESAADPGTTKKAPKLRKKHSHRTIEQNVSALNVCEADRKCEVRRGAPCGSDSLGPAGRLLLQLLGCQGSQIEGCLYGIILQPSVKAAGASPCFPSTFRNDRVERGGQLPRNLLDDICFHSYTQHWWQ